MAILSDAVPLLTLLLALASVGYAAAMLWFAWGHGAGYFDCATVATIAVPFRRHRGAALGVVGELINWPTT